MGLNMRLLKLKVILKRVIALNLNYNTHYKLNHHQSARRTRR